MAKVKSRIIYRIYYLVVIHHNLFISLKIIIKITVLKDNDTFKVF